MNTQHPTPKETADITPLKLHQIIKDSGLTRKEWYSQIYLKSNHWKNLKKRKYKESGRKCDKCGTDKRCEVHHLNYRSIYNVTTADLQVLCFVCHRITHNKRPNKRARKELANRVQNKGMLKSLLHNVECAKNRLTTWSAQRLPEHRILKARKSLDRAQRKLAEFMAEEEAMRKEREKRKMAHQIHMEMDARFSAIFGH